MARQTGLTIRVGGFTQIVARWASLAAIALAIVTFFLTNIFIVDIRYEIAASTFPEALASLGLSPQFYAFYLPTLQAAAILLNVIVAVIIITRRADEPVALLLAVTIVTFSSVNLYHNDRIALLAPALLVAQGINAMIALSTDTVVAYLFPDGRVYPRRLLWFLVPMLVLHIFAVRVIVNSDTTSPGALVTLALEVVSIGLLLYGQWLRYHHILKPEQRQQVKWVLGGFASVSLAITIFLLAVVFVIPTLPPGSVELLLIQLIIDDGLHFLALIGISISIMNAILRRRLWDIDFAINRAIGVLATVLLSAIAFVVAALLLSAVISLSWTLLISSALAVGLFIPLRPVVQRLIDTRVYGLRQPVEAYEPITPPAPQLPVSKPGMYTGKLLDGIELRDLIARGGMGEVYKGYMSEAMYAVKVLPTEHNEEAAIRFEQEAEAMRRIQHPNIVRLQHFGSADGIHYLAMDYVEGIPLRTYIIQRRCMPVNEVFGIVDDLVNALDHVHGKGIIHRDLKPGNIMLNLDAAGVPARAFLLDFGIARIVEMSVTQTGMGNVGTVEYIAPEQILSSRTVTQAADIYSLGVIVYEMLTGERPFKGNAGQVLFGHLKQPAPDPRDLVPKIPMEVSFAVRRALAKEPEDRYESARAFGAALRDTESATSASIRLY